VAPSLGPADEFLDTIRPFLLGHPESVDMPVHTEDDGFAVDIIKTGCLDDPQRGEHHGGFVIHTSDGKWELLSMSITPERWRGEPTIRRCPSPIRSSTLTMLATGAHWRPSPMAFRKRLWKGFAP
jgi:hypothetical protein